MLTQPRHCARGSEHWALPDTIICADFFRLCFVDFMPQHLEDVMWKKPTITQDRVTVRLSFESQNSQQLCQVETFAVNSAALCTCRRLQLNKMPENNVLCCAARRARLLQRSKWLFSSCTEFFPVFSHERKIWYLPGNLKKWYWRKHSVAGAGQGLAGAGRSWPGGQGRDGGPGQDGTQWRDWGKEEDLGVCLLRAPADLKL